MRKSNKFLLGSRIPNKAAWVFLFFAPSFFTTTAYAALLFFWMKLEKNREAVKKTKKGLPVFGGFMTVLLFVSMVAIPVGGVISYIIFVAIYNVYLGTLLMAFLALSYRLNKELKEVEKKTGTSGGLEVVAPFNLAVPSNPPLGSVPRRARRGTLQRFPLGTQGFQKWTIQRFLFSVRRIGEVRRIDAEHNTYWGEWWRDRPFVA